MKRGIVICLGALLSMVPAFGQAQREQPPSPSRGTFLTLTEVQELWDAENYERATIELRELAEKVRDNSYEFALANQYLANTRILAGDSAGARAAVEAALGAGDIPPAIRADLDLFYGQLLIGDEEYEKAAEHLERWLSAILLPPQPKQLFFLAYASYMAGDLPRAREIMERTIAEAGEPNQQWERVYYQILFELGDFDRALDVILGLLELWPEEDDYWRLLANHYMQQEQQREALAAMLLAHIQNPMTEEVDLRRLVNMFGYVEIPERAARLLQERLESGDITEDPDTLRQLGDLWLMARERDKAKAAFQKAAEAAPDGRTYRLLGSIYFEDADWNEAYSAFLEALDLGGLADPPQVRLLAGISAYRAGMNDEARVALEAAAESESVRAQAEALLGRL